MVRTRADKLIAAVDVGTNAVRLEIARVLPDGSLETMHQERDPIRPGEGVFITGRIPPEVVDRLVATLRRYEALCRRYGARVRAVATSAVREAKNGPDVVQRVRDEAGLDLDVVSGREEARLICLGVLRGRPPDARAVVIDIGGGSTEVATALGEAPTDLWSVALGAVRLTQIFSANGRMAQARLAALRAFADEAFREAIPEPHLRVRSALGSSGTIGAVVGFAADGGRRATRQEVTRAVEALAGMSVAERRRLFDPRRAEIVVAGAAVLEAAMRHLGLASVAAVETGLRNGILVELSRRGARADDSTADALVAFGRRFAFDERHARQVARLALVLFDRLARLHRLPPSQRRVLEAAALLHDVGHAVSVHAHHKHTYYLVANADLPGFPDRERELIALVARYHRRSAPSRGRADLERLSTAELVAVRKLVALLRVADALDRGHHQVVRALEVSARGRSIRVRIAASGPTDLELWDAEREAALFRRVFGRRLEVAAPGAVRSGPVRLRIRYPEASAARSARARARARPRSELAAE
ncbi:MAG TPA: Ppx/GppA phosphatase family protein [Anaeromyxobacteraceae bacterium]|nr:Ppx/GppA phosphatase family protein [Anaeromyxobacteraceae bacterium]